MYLEPYLIVLIKATIEAFITFQGTLSSWWDMYYHCKFVMLLHCTPVCSCHDEEKEVEKIEKCRKIRRSLLC